MVGGQASRIQTKSLRTETRNLKIQDGEDVDVLRRPGLNSFLVDFSLLVNLETQLRNKINLETPL